MKKFFKYGIIVLSGFVLNSCSNYTGNKILNIFFDGVPQSDSSMVEIQSENLMDSVVSKVRTRRIDLPIVFYHLPYQEKMCSNCHDVKSAYKTYNTPELCYECHEIFSDSFTNLHYPIESGDCNTCHLPHQSILSSLLIKSEKELCLDCHDSDELFKGDIHSSLIDSECSNCHDPHGSNNDSLLR